MSTHRFIGACLKEVKQQAIAFIIDNDVKLLSLSAYKLPDGRKCVEVTIDNEGESDAS